jgi:hypothetical protein
VVGRGGEGIRRRWNRRAVVTGVEFSSAWCSSPLDGDANLQQTVARGMFPCGASRYLFPRLIEHIARKSYVLLLGRIVQESRHRLAKFES